ncbi:hypothetical protein AMECASPLE_011372 [Ameca splendens]|uniref:Uncharacterized protein n=1 Tax=Ameca splendens TaxID=208324 RepID=A0ABV0Y172_9TELE
MQRWSAGSLAVGLLQSSRGRSTEKWRLQCGAESCCVKATSLLCWTVAAVTVQLETAAHLVKLLDSPVQVEEDLQTWFCLLFHFCGDILCVCIIIMFITSVGNKMCVYHYHVHNQCGK